MARPTGSPNKNKSFLLNRLQAMYGKDFHPIIKIAENCVELQERVEAIVIPELPEEPTDDDIKAVATAREGKVNAIRVANNEWSRIAEYTEPKLKAMELSGPDGGDIGIDAIWRIEVVKDA